MRNHHSAIMKVTTRDFKETYVAIKVTPFPRKSVDIFAGHCQALFSLRVQYNFNVMGYGHNYTP